MKRNILKIDIRFRGGKGEEITGNGYVFVKYSVIIFRLFGQKWEINSHIVLSARLKSFEKLSLLVVPLEWNAG